jgi:hypothetical protein
MKRIMTSTTGRALAVFLSLAMALLNVSLAEAQGDGTTGLMAAGVYVEEVEQEPGQEQSVQGRVIVLYADGNWTLYDPTTISPMYGIWEEAGGTSTDTDTGTDTDTATDTDTDTDTSTGTGTDTSTGTGTDTGAVTLDGALFDPNTGDQTSYTLGFDEAFNSLTLTNGTEEATFTRVAIGTDTDTETSTSTDTDTETSTSTDTDTETSTSTDTDTETSTSTDTSTETSTSTDTSTETSTSTDTSTETSTSTDTDTGTSTGTSTTLQ